MIDISFGNKYTNLCFYNYRDKKTNVEMSVWSKKGDVSVDITVSLNDTELKELVKEINNHLKEVE